jgi:hypothetical protein
VFSPPDGDLPSDESGRAGYRYLAAVHEFDADGHHRLVRTCVLSRRCAERMEFGAASGGQLRDMVGPYLAAGWRPGDIWVRPFLVEIDGWNHGLLFQASGEGLEGDCNCEDEPGECILFCPFGFALHPPYDTGEYDT